MIHQIVTHKYIVLILTLLIAIPFVLLTPKIKTVNNLDYFRIKNDPDILFHERLKAVFGNDEFLIIAFKKDALFTAKNLDLLKRITDDLGAIDGVLEIKSLSNVDDIIGQEEFFIVRKFLETIPDDPKSLEKYKKRAVGNPLYLKNLISPDGNTAAIVIFFHVKPNEPDFRKKIITQTETLLEKYKSADIAFHVAGWTFTNHALARYLTKDITTFIPIGSILIPLIVFLFFGNIRLTLISIVNISLCVGCTMGLMPIFGVSLNTLTIIIPPVVMALALSDTVHIFSSLDETVIKQFPDKEQAFEVILRKLVKPCFLTSLTTAVGFSSLYLNDSPPIKEFAIITAAGMILEFFFSFTFLPAFMLLFDEKKLIQSFFRSRTGSLDMRIFLCRISDFNLKYFRWISLCGILISILSVWLSFQLKFESNLLDNFKPRSPVRISTEFVEKELAGVESLDISFKADSIDTFKQPGNLLIIEELQNKINTIEGVDKTLSIVDFIKGLNKSFHNENPVFYQIPDSVDLISQYLLIYDSDGMKNFVNALFNHARMSIRLSKHSTRDQALMIKQIKAFVETMDTKELDIQVSGLVLQQVKTIDTLVKGQLYSLATSIIIILLIIFFILGSVPLSLLSMIPNLFPIALNFGIMGLFKIPINGATAMISAVVIGIAVDDTIHFMMELKKNLSGLTDTREAITKSLQVKGKAMILSSLILFVGFGVTMFSQFVPTRNFGLLSSLMMFWTLLGDILLLPSTIMVVSTMTRIKLHK